MGSEIEMELKKRGITKVEKSLVKFEKKKWNTVYRTEK
jgi:hypothetical protein